jgi:hypothetical protein
MAVTGEPYLEGKGGEVVETFEQIERSSESQPELITIERHALDLLKDLGEIYGRAMDFGGNIGEGPAAGQVGAEEELDAIDHALISECAGCSSSGAGTESALKEGDCEAFGFERFSCAFAKAITQHRHERLGSCINAEPVCAKRSGRSIVDQGGLRYLREERRVSDNGKACVAA